MSHHKKTPLSKRCSCSQRLTAVISSFILLSANAPFALAQSTDRKTTHPVAQPVLRPLSGAKGEEIPAPKSTMLHAGIEERGSLNFGAILLKDNDAFPAGFACAPFPQPKIQPTLQKASVSGKQSKPPVLSGKVQQEAAATQAAKDSRLPFDLTANNEGANLQAQTPQPAQLPQTPLSAQTATSPDTALGAAGQQPQANSQPNYQYQPGWMSYQTTTQTTNHQTDYNWQQSQSQLVNQQTTQYNVSQVTTKHKSSSRKWKSLHLNWEQSITNVFTGSGNLFNHANNFLSGAGGFANGAFLKVTNPLDKLQIAVNRRVDDLQLAVSKRVDKVHQAVATRVTKVKRSVATRVDKTIQKAGSFGYTTAQRTVNKIWHPGSFQQRPDNNAGYPAQGYPPGYLAISPVVPEQNTAVSSNDAPSNAISVRPEPLPTAVPETAVSAVPMMHEVVPAALAAVPVLGHFAAPAPPVQSEINWDPWYRDLISESCQTWATVERLPGKVDLLVTVRCDGQIECLAAPSPKAPTKISPSAQITAAQNKEMLARATVSINAMSQQAVTHFPAASKRKSVSFEMELVSTATDVAKFTDACKPDIEHVASLRSTAQLNQGAMPYELLEEKRLSWTSKLAEERKPGIIWFLVQSI